MSTTDDENVAPEVVVEQEHVDEDLVLDKKISTLPSPTSVPDKLNDIDRMALNLAKSRKELAYSEAKNAITTSQKADLEYQYVVMQLYVKYGLTLDDGITEDGSIVIGAKLKQDKGQ